MARGMHKPKKLARRLGAYNVHGKNPSQNPSNSSGTGHDMHKPGSYK